MEIHEEPQFTIFQKLDIVLNIFRRYPTDMYVSMVRKRALQFFLCSEKDMEILVHRLHADKLIDQSMSGMGGTEIYKINVSGQLFPGYVEQEKINAAENTRLEKLENDQRANQTLTTRLTILIAVGTLVAAIYYGIEIYKELHQFAHRHGRYWIWEQIPAVKTK